MTLKRFIEHHNRLPQEWGKVDCCLALADWAVWLGQEDPAIFLRGSYRTEEGCKELVRSSGGLVPLIEMCNEKTRLWTRTPDPVTGSIGVIGSAKVINRQFGAIYDGRRWNVRMEQGFVGMTASPISIWSCECL